MQLNKIKELNISTRSLWCTSQKPFLFAYSMSLISKAHRQSSVCSSMSSCRKLWPTEQGMGVHHSSSVCEQTSITQEVCLKSKGKHSDHSALQTTEGA